MGITDSTDEGGSKWGSSEAQAYERPALTHEEYEAVCTRPRCFLVLRNDVHVLSEVENVVERHERYWVVEKIGVAPELAERRARLQATHSE